METRFEVDGVRYYRTGDRPELCYPSVTAILGAVASEASKKALAQWAINNPGGREAAANRGTIIHKACEDHLRGREVDVPDALTGFWDGMQPLLDEYSSVLWSEKPLRPEWMHCTGIDGISRVWSHNYGYTGCPDLVGIRHGQVFLADFKTSVAPYCRYYPKESRDRSRFGGWTKFTKCALQMAAYAIAFEETLGERIHAGQIMVTTPQVTQSFILRGDELEGFKVRWLQKKRIYNDILEGRGQAPYLLRPVSSSGQPAAMADVTPLAA